jgi:predicted nucleic acid-binding protein
VDEEIALRWGLLASLASGKGKPLAVIDGLLAATALQSDLTLVTRNIGDFAVTQVPVLNPWES